MDRKARRWRHSLGWLPFLHPRCLPLLSKGLEAQGMTKARRACPLRPGSGQASATLRTGSGGHPGVLSCGSSAADSMLAVYEYQIFALVWGPNNFLVIV